MPEADDLKYANDQERRYALAYLRWLAGGAKRRKTAPSPGHAAYGLSPQRAEQIEQDIRSLATDASENF